MATRELYSSAEPDVIRAVDKFANGESPIWPLTGDAAFWDPSAPAGVRNAYESGEITQAWKLWRRHLQQRPGPKRPAHPDCRSRLRAFFRSKRGEGALVAGDMVPPAATRAAWLVEMIQGKVKKSQSARVAAAEHAESWLSQQVDSQAAGSPSEVDAWEAIVWTHALAPLSRLLDSEIWWRLASRLHGLATSVDIALDADPLANQLAGGELPWTLSCVLPELNPCRSLAARAKNALSLGFADLLDGRGLPQAQSLKAFQPLIACWTRCRLAGKFSHDRAKNKKASLCWNKDAELQYPLAVLELLRLSRFDATGVLVAPAAAELSPTESANDCQQVARSFLATRQLAKVAAEQFLRKKDRRTIQALIAARSGDTESKHAKHSATRAAKLPEPSVHSEWSHLAILSTDWSPRANRLAVAYNDQRVRIDLELRRRMLLQGVWEFEAQVDGVPALPQGEWSEVCWVNDTDCDYLELEMQLTGGLRIQRQMLLARHDEFLFLSDVLVGAEPRELSYRGRLPLAANILLEPVAEHRDDVDLAMSAVTGVRTSAATRELVFTAGKPRAMALPLALSEWRADSRGGDLIAADGTLELQQTARGHCLYAPLWLDLSAKRFQKSRTWRQLTVVEQLVPQPRDVAVGYRIQFGSRQWIVYRALTARGNRTLLGQNLSTEFFLGRFQRDGETVSILEVE